MKRVGVLILTDWRSNCLKQLIKNLQSLDIELDIFLCAKEKKLYFDNVNYIIYNEKDFNYSKISNLALNNMPYINYEYILLVNDDIIPTDCNWLKNMINCMEAHDAHIIGAKLLYPNTKKIQHFGIGFRNKSILDPIHLNNKIIDKNIETDTEFKAVTFACALIKSKCFNVCTLDENLKKELQDVDYCLTIGKIWCCASAKLYHYESYTRKLKRCDGQNINDRKYWELKWVSYSI
jgi:GT2 family glycosyltransferase